LEAIEEGVVSYAVDLLDDRNIYYPDPEKADNNGRTIYLRNKPLIAVSVESRKLGEVQLTPARCLRTLADVPASVAQEVQTETSAAFENEITRTHEWGKINAEAALLRQELVIDLQNRGLKVIDVDKID